MNTLSNLTAIRSRLRDHLTLYGKACIVLRALVDPAWLRAQDEQELHKIGLCMATLARRSPAHVESSGIQTLLDSLKSTSSKTKLTRVLRKTQKQGLDCSEMTWIGEQWQEIRMIFENEIVKALPQEFRRRLASKGDILRNVWALRFVARSEQSLSTLDESIRAEIDERGYCVVCMWREAQLFLKNPGLSPDWPDVRRAIRRVDTVCKSFSQSAKTDFSPSVKEIEDVAIEIVTKELPKWMPRGARPLAPQDELALREGELLVPYVLQPRDLRRAIHDRFGLNLIAEWDLDNAIKRLRERGLLVLRELVHGSYGAFDKICIYNLGPVEFSDPSADESQESDLKSRLLEAIAREGRDAKPIIILRAAQVENQAGRNALRELERRGEYGGFGRPVPRRYLRRTSQDS